VFFIDQGVTVGERRLREQPNHPSPRHWRIHALDDSALAAALVALGVSEVVPVADGVDIATGSEAAVADLIAALVGAGIQIVSCTPVQTSLEATYFELTAPE
jgi:hypothetical protein